MGANIAGIYGAQIFRSDDRPRYRRAFSVNIGVLVFGLGLAIFRYLDDRRLRRRGDQQSTIGPARASSISNSNQDSEKVGDEKGTPPSEREDPRRQIVEPAK